MDKDIFIYSNARARTLENTLLSSEKMTRLTFAENLDEGVKILFEANYGGNVVIESAYEYEKLLAAENANVTAFLRETVTPGTGLECFLLTNDYHNAKALAKAKYSGIDDVSFMMMPSGLSDSDGLKDNIFDDNYVSLPDEMAAALKRIDLAFATGTRSPRLIDTTLDKALFSHIKRVMETCSEQSVKKYFTCLADFKNLSAFFRCRMSELPFAFFEEGFVSGGEMELSQFSSMFDQPLDACCDSFKFKPAGELASFAAEGIKKGEGLAAFEAESDNFLMGIFKAERIDLFSVAPTAGFYVAKQTEIKTLRMVLICLKSSVEKSEVKKRLRELYG